MKLRRLSHFISALALVSLAGCSGMGSKSESGKELSASGPTIMNARTVPSTIELNKSLQPAQSPEILADVKDFSSTVSDVRVRFIHVPLEIPMTNIGGTTWRATLTPQQLRQLAVSGQTMQYDVNVIARNQKGQSITSQEPISLAVKTPELATSPG
ncbi:MAG TPA: hypothetical protein VJB59_01960 [Bdellovibrionota bacterium]|nr:hypothetical protein [Bdellovibrionota bacterium]